MENKNGRGIFLGVVSVATLIVAIIGATFAYFVASANGNAGAAAANSASVAGTLSIVEASDIRTQLIPVTKSIMLTSYGQTAPNDCKGYSAAGGATQYDLCSTYTFTVNNTASVAQTIYVTFSTVGSNFTNLYYMIVDGADNSGAAPTERTTAKAVPAQGTPDSNIVTDTLAAESGTHTYTVIMWVNETTNDQTDADSGKSFTGTVTVSSANGENNITGVIAQVGQQGNG